MPAVYFFAALLSFAFGIFLRTFFEWGLPVVVWLLLMGFALALIWRRSGEAAAAPFILLTTLTIAFAAFGMLRLEVASWQYGHSPLAEEVGQEVTLTGAVVREPDVREVSTHLYVRTDTDTVLAVIDRHAAVTYGDTVTLTGELEEPDSFVTDYGRTFDYPGYLRARGVEYRLAFAEVDAVQAGRGNPIIASLLSFKHDFMAALERVLPEPQVGLGQGLLLGVKQALGEDIEAAFRETGIIHIVVLSGFNVMLVISFTSYLLAFFLPARARAIVGILAIIAFALLVGLSATVVRASIMAGLFLIASLFSRRYDILRALVFAGALMLLVNPYLLVYDVGFQLSFLATLGLVLAAPNFENLLAAAPSDFGIRGFLVATIATQIAVLPLLLYQIGEFSVVAVLVNVLVLPAVAAAMLATFIAGLAALFAPAIAPPLAALADLTLSYILVIATTVADWPFASFVVPAFPFWVVPVAYALLGVAYWRWGVRSIDTTPAPQTATGSTSVTTVSTHSDDLANWTIIDEAELRAQLRSRMETQSGAGRRPAPPEKTSEEIPIFFR